MSLKFSIVMDQIANSLSSKVVNSDKMLAVHLNVIDDKQEEAYVNSDKKSILLTDARKAEKQQKRQVLKRVFFNIPKKSQKFILVPMNPNSLLMQRWRMFMLFPLGYEVWAFPYRLALGVPSLSNQMAITPIDFVSDLLFLFDMLVALGTSVPNPAVGEVPLMTFGSIARNYFRKKFPFEILPSFPFWVATFVATNHLQDPAQCGRISLSLGPYLNWSCVLNTQDWNIYSWWIASVVRVSPRLIRLIVDFKAMESNLVKPTMNEIKIDFRLILIAGNYCQRTASYQICDDNLSRRALGKNDLIF